MNLELEVYGALCATSTFRINDVEADYEDFGDNYDHYPEGAEEYGCGDMKFTPRPSTTEVLEKYKISEAEYLVVCARLDVLSFGRCGWCV